MKIGYNYWARPSKDYSRFS